MTRTEYFENTQNLLSKGQITEEVFWAIIENADDYAYEHGHEDYDRCQHINRIRHERG